MVSRYTTLVPYLGLRIGPACEAGLTDGMRRERVPPKKRKKEKRLEVIVSRHGRVSKISFLAHIFANWRYDASATAVARYPL